MSVLRRRQLLGAAAAAAGLAACGREPPPDNEESSVRFNWKLITSWPRELPGIGGAARRVAERISRMSGGRLNVRLYAADDLVPAFDVFDAVSSGRAEMGHSSAAYWTGKSPATAAFSTLPFGLTAVELNAWLQHGGGLKLWRQLYARFGLRPYPCGNTGVQMAGWFKRELRSVKDFKNLKIRISGPAAESYAQLGAVPVSVPGAGLEAAMRDGTLDACEWLGPLNDLSAGLHRVAKYCYYPGWQEPGFGLELMLNKRAYEELPDDLQAIVEYAAQSVNDDLLAEYTARNPEALATLVNEHKIEFRKLPDDVLTALKQSSETQLAARLSGDALNRQIHESYLEFREQARQWQRLSETAFVQARG